MHLHHAISHHFRTLTRQYPVLRRLSVTALALILVWFYAIHYGERTSFRSHVQACGWSQWEHWPEEAAPHHLVFVADPQIVDPHTYPGRPWPLSTLTERYTDRYMRRNFRLVNEELDPDSVVFLGDLFDGGREWATSKARPLRSSQRQQLEVAGVGKSTEGEKNGQAAGTESRSDESSGEHAGVVQADKLGKRSEASYKAAIMSHHSRPVHKEDHFLDKRGNDLKEFVHGENGRWRKWGPKQWDKEFDRFGKIFFEPGQLYPHGNRRAFAAWEVPTHPITVENGAKDVEWQEYAIAGGKTRRLLTSLPGNHDIGFGPGVQLAVRDRFNSHFGETNRVDVLGNHTFVSIDALSLAAFSQFEVGGDTTQELADQRRHIWKDAMAFLDGIQLPAASAVSDALNEYFSGAQTDGDWMHTVVEPGEKGISPNARPPAGAQLPVILLSHVPLFRDPDTDCGKLRERGHALSIAGGYQYQNVLTKSLSTLIAQKVSAAGEIVHAFSGDDHDYCDVTHRYNVGSLGKNRGPGLKSIREITVKSFSWAMGVRIPGFVMLSLWNPVDAKGETIGTPLPTIQSHLCLLPDQIGILIVYAQLAGVSLVVLLVRAVVLSLRPMTGPDLDGDEGTDTLSNLGIPRFRATNGDIANGTANGYSTPNKASTKGRQRASSTGLKPSSANAQLGVQRSMNARTRSVSPAPPGTLTPSRGGYGLPPGGTLIEKAGYYPPVRWTDPADESDEEKSVGDFAEADSQAKWKKRRRAPTKVRRAIDEFFKSVALVGLFAGGYYVIMVRTG